MDHTSAPASIVIIGNGIAGITAARHIRKLSNQKITVISSESPYFFSRTALMYVYMGHMRMRDIIPYENWFWKKNRIDLVFDHVVQIDHLAKNIRMQSGHQIVYDKLVIACGSTSNRLQLPGANAANVRCLYSLQDLEYIESISSSIRKAVIIGGGLIGIELTEMLQSRNIPVTFLVREHGFLDMLLPPEGSQMVGSHIREHGIDLRLDTQAMKIITNNQGEAAGVVTNTGEHIECDFIGMTVGVRPNICWLAGSALEMKQGILVDPFLRTSLQDIYAIGDCAELKIPPEGHKAIEPVWYTGRMMGECVAHTLCGMETIYHPGPWYNSAKFFNIEYQVYGSIQVNLDAHVHSYLWQSPDKNKCLRINYSPEEGVMGFNLMGIRFRQEICERWLLQKSCIEDVMENIQLAFFDAELSTTYTRSIQRQFEAQTGKVVKRKSHTGYNPVYQFLHAKG